MTQECFDFDKTRSAEEALELLKRYRAGYIATAREAAVDLCHRYGMTDAVQVKEAIPSTLKHSFDNGIPLRWCGAIFKDERFEMVPDQTTVGAVDKRTNNHGGQVLRKWRLKR